MIFDPLYWIVIGAGMLLSLWASGVAKSRFAKYSQLGTRSQMTGADVARGILAQNGIRDVTVCYGARDGDHCFVPFSYRCGIEMFTQCSVFAEYDI